MISSLCLSPRNPLSNHQRSPNFYFSKKQIRKQSLFFCKVIKKIFFRKMSSSLMMLKEEKRRIQRMRELWDRVQAIVRKQKKRVGLTRMKARACEKRKKNLGSRLITIIFCNMIKRRKKKAVEKIGFFGKERMKLKKIKNFSIKCLFNLLIKIINNKKNSAFQQTKFFSSCRTVVLNSFQSILKKKVFVLKLTGFSKLKLKYPFSRQTPTTQAQQQVSRKNKQKKTAQISLQKVAKNLRKSIEKSNNSTSKKSKISSLDEDFYYLMNSSSKKSNQKDENYYKIELQSYKKQLNIAKVELQVTKSMNEMYEKEIQERKLDRERKNLEEIVGNLKISIQKYKRQSQMLEKKKQNLLNQMKSKAQYLKIKYKNKL